MFMIENGGNNTYSIVYVLLLKSKDIVFIYIYNHTKMVPACLVSHNLGCSAFHKQTHKNSNYRRRGISVTWNLVLSAA